MITEEARQTQEKDQRDENIKWLKQIIDAAARYERLMSNKDFQDYLSDRQKIIQLHEGEIQGYLQMIAAAPSIFKRMRLMEVITQHQIRKECVEESILYPHQIIQKAREAREELKTIREKENHHDQ